MWKPILTKTSQPKYSAIADKLEQNIRGGLLRPGDQLPTHRELADSIGVNVSTITRAYKEAERRRLIAATVGRGTFVAADACAVLDLVPKEGMKTDLIEMGLVTPLYGQEENLVDIINRLSRNRRLEDYMKYTDPAGLPEHRVTGAHWVKRYGLNVGPERIVITAGAQHAMACSMLSCFQQGDRIAVDALTYPGFKTLAGMLGIRLVAIPSDEHGMIPETLHTACRRDEIKGIYLMPGVQNPTAIHIPKTRREKLADMILRHKLLLLEDDVYEHTCSKHVPALSTLVPDNSIFIAGLSKIMYPGLRSAYVVAIDKYRDLLIKAILNTLWMSPTLNAAIIAECINSGAMEKTIVTKRKEAVRRNTLVSEKLAGFTYTGMPAGYFIWIWLPKPWTGLDFEIRSRQLGVNIFSAEKFAVGGVVPPSAVRISLSGSETQVQLTKGLDIISKILRENYNPDVAIF
jgi:DNA-binding transcriptional MocR family regulator